MQRETPAARPSPSGGVHGRHRTYNALRINGHPEEYTMEFGVAFTSRIGDYDLVALAESLGFDQAWFFDSQIMSPTSTRPWRSPRATRRIRLATGVAVPTTRMAPVIAHSIASVAELRRPRRTRRRQRQHRAPDHGPLTGAAGPHEARDSHHPGLAARRDHSCMKRKVKVISFNCCIGMTASSISIITSRSRCRLSVTRPSPIAAPSATRTLTWHPSAESLTANRKIIDDAARKAGRNPALIPSKAIAPLEILRPGETAGGARVLESLGPFITNLLHVMIEWDGGLLRSSPRIANLVERYRAYVESLPKDRRHLILHEGHLVYTQRGKGIPDRRHR